MSSKNKKNIWQNRIVNHGEKPAAEFVANDKNWRTHNKAQRQAIGGIMQEIGWVQGVVVNRTTGRLVDGHLRVEEALQKGDRTPVPFIEVELSEEEERKVLALFDPIGAMASQDAEKLQELLETIDCQSAELQLLVEQMSIPFEIPEFREFTEEVEETVEYVTCPNCEHRFPK